MNTPDMNAAFARLLQQFFLDRLLQQRNASAQTVASYRDTFRLLLQFAERQLHKPPARLELTDLDASFVLAFLNHLERERKNSIRSRNARLAAIRSFLHYAALKAPTALPEHPVGACHPAQALRATDDWLSLPSRDCRRAQRA